MTKLEIIEETAAFYNKNNRGTAYPNGTGALCEYLTKDGRMCAVGRCMIAPKNDMIGSICTVNANLLRDNLGGLEAALKPEYRGHDIDFWMKLQGFHDNVAYWDENGLTQEGLKHKQFLIKYSTL